MTHGEERKVLKSRLYIIRIYKKVVRGLQHILEFEKAQAQGIQCQTNGKIITNM